jgi:hypothetical protein
LPFPKALTTTNAVAYSFDSNFTNFFGTNATTATTSRKAEVKALPTDPMLDETENILEDYISALSLNQTLIANHE